MVRKAEISDSESIASVLVKTWETAYEGIIDSDYPKQLEVSFFTKIMNRNIEENLETIFVTEIYLHTLKSANNNGFYLNQGFLIEKEFDLPIGDRTYI